MYGLRVTGRQLTGRGTRWLVIPIMIICMGSTPVTARQKPMETRLEYKIKASFLYNFLFYVTWPETGPGNADRPRDSKIVIGMMGKDPFGDFFKIVEGKKVFNKRIVIRRFKAGTHPSLLSQCHILFISASLKPVVADILESIEDYPVLTVSEIQGFAQKGGMINFVAMENNVSFEINRNAAAKVGITLSSKILRVAASIVETEHGKE